jgi:hypothetical protein
MYFCFINNLSFSANEYPIRVFPEREERQLPLEGQLADLAQPNFVVRRDATSSIYSKEY